MSSEREFMSHEPTMLLLWSQRECASDPTCFGIEPSTKPYLFLLHSSMNYIVSINMTWSINSWRVFGTIFFLILRNEQLWMLEMNKICFVVKIYFLKCLQVSLRIKMQCIILLKHLFFITLIDLIKVIFMNLRKISTSTNNENDF